MYMVDSEMYQLLIKCVWFHAQYYCSVVYKCKIPLVTERCFPQQVIGVARIVDSLECDLVISLYLQEFHRKDLVFGCGMFC